MDSLYTERFLSYLQKTEDALKRWLPPSGAPWDTVVHGMQYACEGGGKRLRPLLLLEFCRLCGGEPEDALPFACAVEMIHSYSLVHDDMPCMDNSPMRRGKPSVHAAFGEDMALLVGDGLLTYAFETMLNPALCRVPASRALSAAFTLASKAGIAGMVGGQTMDLESEGHRISPEALWELQEGKTAAMLEAACRMGVQLAGGTAEQELIAERFGQQLGHGFQIVDDILDATADVTTLGKPVGEDAAAQKNTYVTLLGLEKAQSLAAECTKAALSALDVFGTDADELRRLTAALLKRDH
ncbi:MAG: polyprenyl synthetase family protein [Eubacteriales bacterium]